MKEVLDFIVKNLSIIISIIALIISITNLIYLIITNKKKIVLKIDNYTKREVHDKEFYFFNVTITNKSRLPIAINEITINYKKENYSFVKSPRLLLEGQTTRGEEVIRRKEIYSSRFPININGLCSEQMFLVMYGPQEFKNEKIKINVKTSRGQVKKRLKNFNNYFIESDLFFKELRNYN